MKRVVWLGTVIAILVATGLIAYRAGAGSPYSTATRVESSDSSSRPSPSLASPTASPRAASVMDGSGELASRFVTAWLNTSAIRRRAKLEATCSARLTDLLSQTDTGKIPQATPVGSPTALLRSQGAMTYTQGLSDGTWIAFDLVPDADSRTGWIVTSVRPGES